jgi:hypothetical protein
VWSASILGILILWRNSASSVREVKCSSLRLGCASPVRLRNPSSMESTATTVPITPSGVIHRKLAKNADKI